LVDEAASDMLPPDHDRANLALQFSTAQTVKMHHHALPRRTPRPQKKKIVAHPLWA